MKDFCQSTNRNVSMRMRKDERWASFRESCEQLVPLNAIQRLIAFILNCLCMSVCMSVCLCVCVCVCRLYLIVVLNRSTHEYRSLISLVTFSWKLSVVNIGQTTLTRGSDSVMMTMMMMMMMTMMWCNSQPHTLTHTHLSAGVELSRWQARDRNSPTVTAAGLLPNLWEISAKLWLKFFLNLHEVCP